MDLRSRAAVRMFRAAVWREACFDELSEEEEKALRRSVNRGTPWGSPAWQKRIAARLGIESSLRPRGRPAKPKAREDNRPKK